MERPSLRWLQDPARAVLAARVLWIALAVVVWNVVFDRVIVLAGREYVYAATLAARDAGVYLSARDWMNHAVTRGLWMASAGAFAVLIVGLGLVTIAARRRTDLKT